MPRQRTSENRPPDESNVTSRHRPGTGEHNKNAPPRGGGQQQQQRESTIKRDIRSPDRSTLQNYSSDEGSTARHSYVERTKAKYETRKKDHSPRGDVYDKRHKERENTERKSAVFGQPKAKEEMAPQAETKVDPRASDASLVEQTGMLEFRVQALPADVLDSMLRNIAKAVHQATMTTIPAAILEATLRVLPDAAMKATVDSMTAAIVSTIEKEAKSPAGTASNAGRNQEKKEKREAADGGRKGRKRDESPGDEDVDGEDEGDQELDQDDDDEVQSTEDEQFDQPPKPEERTSRSRSSTAQRHEPKERRRGDGRRHSTEGSMKMMDFPVERSRPIINSEASSTVGSIKAGERSRKDTRKQSRNEPPSGENPPDSSKTKGAHDKSRARHQQETIREDMYVHESPEKPRNRETAKKDKPAAAEKLNTVVDDLLDQIYREGGSDAGNDEFEASVGSVVRTELCRSRPNKDIAEALLQKLAAADDMREMFVVLHDEILERHGERRKSAQGDRVELREVNGKDVVVFYRSKMEKERRRSTSWRWRRAAWVQSLVDGLRGERSARAMSEAVREGLDRLGVAWWGVYCVRHSAGAAAVRTPGAEDRRATNEVFVPCDWLDVWVLLR